MMNCPDSKALLIARIWAILDFRDAKMSNFKTKKYRKSESTGKADYARLGARALYTPLRTLTNIPWDRTHHYHPSPGWLLEPGKTGLCHLPARPAHLPCFTDRKAEAQREGGDEDPPGHGTRVTPPPLTPQGNPGSGGSKSLGGEVECELALRWQHSLRAG